MDETIIKDSSVGQRLEKIKKSEVMYIKFDGKNIPLVSQISIGRERASQIYIDDNLVSRKHALIQKLKDAFFIKDLGSTNGTYVNGKKIPQDKYVRINKNDVIKIGRTDLTIRRFIE